MNRTLVFDNRPYIIARASACGVKESEGPLGSYFDRVFHDDLLGQESWELAEGEMLRQTTQMCIERGGLLPGQVGAVFMGDLLNQIISSGFAARELGCPYFGIYGACSTFVEGMALGAMMVDGGYRESAVSASSSHFCTAERQYRFPLEMGGQRTPSAQWTATAAGAVMMSAVKSERAIARVDNATIGRVIDYDIDDANHMGAAMAPAVADTICRSFEDTGRGFADYDMVATGDLGRIGRDILIELLEERGIKVDRDKLLDCGASLFDESQGCGSGGSGCGCVASVSTGYLMSLVEDGSVGRLMIVGSGALLSTTSSQQGQSIPGVAYSVALEGMKK